jgi:hypothetical protein
LSAELSTQSALWSGTLVSRTNVFGGNVAFLPGKVR